MARIPDAEIERIKTEVSLVRLVEAAGVELKKHGKDFVGRCPFHQPDKTPSLVVTPDKNLWHCLGACNTGGTVIDWTMKMQGVSFRHAVELLKGGAPSLAAKEKSEPKPLKRNTTAKLPSDLSAEADEQHLMQRVVAYYHATLKQSPEVLDYLRQRGLVHPELIDTFKLGYANRTLAYRLPEKNRAAGEAIRTKLQGLGILRESGHEHFNGSLVIPILDAAGNVVQLYGRKLRDDLRPGTPKHLYLPRPHAGVFNRPALAASKEIILCEALIDALTFWVGGYRNVTSSYGVNGCTDELLEAFKTHGTQRVLIAFDRDEAGEKAAAELAPRLMAAGIECFRILFPHGLDANAYALKVQPAGKSLGVAIRGAQWMGKGAKVRSLPVPESEPETSAPVNEPEPISSLAADAPPAITTEIPIEIRAHEILILLGDRRWRVRGLSPEPTPGQLKVNLLVSRGDGFHVDTLDLYQTRLRLSYAKQAAAELAFSEETLKRDLGAVLLKLEALQTENAAQVPKAPALTLTDAEKAEAMSLLRDPNLVERIVADLTACGIVGEDVNKLVSYLACVSRKLDRPLAIVIQSLSAAGKSALMDAVLDLVPEEERVHYSAMTGQSLFYLGEQDLKHKILAIAEEQGVQQAAYALKLLQSQGELTIASTGKDPVTGELKTRPYRVEGPVMLFLTTTAADLDDELQNRCLVLTINESREQTRAIHAQQRQAETLDGLLAGETQKRIRTRHRNAQRLLRPLKVVNPFAPKLSFLDDRTRLRRDHRKYLSLIRAIALLHQYQRDIKTTEHRGEVLEYIEVTAQDVRLANQLAHQVLGQSLDDLPPQTRRLLALLHELVQACGEKSADVRFSRREVREHTQWGHTQLRVHLERLVELEYLLVHRGRQGASFVYELLWQGEGQDGKSFLMGLSDPEATVTTAASRGEEPHFAGGVRPPNGGSAGGVRDDKTPGEARPDSISEEVTPKEAKRGTPAHANGAGHSPSLIPLAAAAR